MTQQRTDQNHFQPDSRHLLVQTTWAAAEKNEWWISVIIKRSTFSTAHTCKTQAWQVKSRMFPRLLTKKSWQGIPCTVQVGMDPLASPLRGVATRVSVMWVLFTPLFLKQFQNASVLIFIKVVAWQQPQLCCSTPQGM
jgi:hypothetical protein